MSFNNDEDGDGLAALFGGVTPQATPKPAEAARPAVVPTPSAQQPAPGGYPTAAPAAAPGYPAATSYDLPAPTEAPPASGYPPATPQYPGLAPIPTADPQYPAQLPAQFPATQVPPTQYSAPQYPATQYPPTQNPAPQYPGLETPAGYPGLAPSYDLPAPVGQSPSAQQPVTQQPVTQPPVTQTATQYPAQAAASGAPAPLTDPSGYPGYQQPVPGYATAPPAEYAGPTAYDLPPPAAAPSLPPVSAYEPAPAHAPTPTYDPAAGYDATRQYAAAAGYPQPTGYEPPQAEQLRSAGQPAPLVQPAQEQFGAPSLAPTSASGYGGSEPPVGAELLPQPVTPAGPLLPSRTAAVVTPEDLARSTVGEKIGLALAVIAGPIGLLVAIVTAIRGGRRRGWLIGISRVSLALGVLSTIATVIAGVVLWNIRVAQIEHDDLAASSAEFCAAAEADPAMVTPPTLGFPTAGNSISETIDAMTVWTTRWTELAATSPTKLRTGLELLAEKGQTITDSVTESRLIDETLNAQVIGAAQLQSGVADWYTNYCVAP